MDREEEITPLRLKNKSGVLLGGRACLKTAQQDFWMSGIMRKKWKEQAPLVCSWAEIK
jgi:hypothetical protein